MLMSKADSDQMQTSSDANCLKDSTNSLSKASLKVTKLQLVDLSHVYIVSQLYSFLGLIPATHT